MSLNEENARILLLGCLMTLYVFFGALVIRKFESPFEKRQLRNYWKIYGDFEEKLSNGTADLDELRSLLHAYGNLTAALGVPGQHERWNFLGSLHFVVTIVTTIGYGSYTPNTNAGKIFVILFGFVGCAGGILFFNLFLERMITFFAFILREIYVRKLQSRDPSPDLNIEQLIAEWKPSIYSVMLCLFVCVVSIGSVAVPAYSALEGWSYVEAAYFCFVSFATIGFGDFVAAQNHRHNNVYVLANIVALAIGCCFLYSVFNVISIVLKQILNWLIYRLEALSAYWRLISRRRHTDRMLRKYSLKMQKERRHCHRRKSSVHSVRRTLRRKEGVDCADGAEPYDAERKMSDDGLISMKDFFTSNQVSLALMQKQLQDSAREHSGPWQSPPPAPSPPVSRHPAPAVPTVSAGVAPAHKSSFPAGRFIPGTIGPLAILCDKLGDR